MVSMVSILLTMQKKKYTSENDPIQAQITMREFQFFESIIEKSNFLENFLCYAKFEQHFELVSRFVKLSLLTRKSTDKNTTWK
jgi:hypothetical protein